MALNAFQRAIRDSVGSVRSRGLVGGVRLVKTGHA